MKALQGKGSASITATPDECIAMLAAVDRYPSWHPEVIREVEVLSRAADGLPSRARTTVHVALGPVARDFRFEMTVTVQPGRSVTLARLPNEPSDPEQLELRWEAEPGQLRIQVSARLEVPRLLPVGGLGDSLAQGFAEAAKRVLEGSSPNASASSS